MIDNNRETYLSIWAGQLAVGLDVRECGCLSLSVFPVMDH